MKPNDLLKEKVTLRDLTHKDIPFILDYWFKSDKKELEAMAVDLTKLPSRDTFLKELTERVIRNENCHPTQMNVLVVEYDRSPVGFHVLAPVHQGDHGIFHAHIWNKNFRGRGLGLISYQKACNVFMERFNLKKILFKTPSQNRGAIRVKEKLNIPQIGEEIVNFGIIQENTHATVFELLANHPMLD